MTESAEEDQRAEIEFEGWPELTDAVLVAAFEGWNDAGDAATGSIEHLELIWDAKPLMAIDPDEYYDFQVNRPTVSLVEGVTRRVSWPTTRMSVCRPPGAAFDLVLVRGIEPNMRWRAFCDEILDVVRALDVRGVVMLGAPHYDSQTPNPKATLALLHRVEEVLDVPIPLAELPQQADEWQKLVDEMAAEDDEVTEYIRNLEQRDDEIDRGEMGATSGDAIAREFERYLRRRDRGHGFGSGSGHGPTVG